MDLRSDFNGAISALYTREECGVLWRRTLSAVCGVEMSKTYFMEASDLTPMQQEEVRSIAVRLSQGEPLEYIVGFAEFCSLRFKVTPATLIPRLETQEIADRIIHTFNSTDHPRILDIGTGSGCIAITIAKALPGAIVTAIDISAEALKTAAENAALNQTPNVRFAECDFLDTSATAAALTPEAKFDLIVSNPPYVRPSEKPTMPQRVLDYEPHTALFVPEDDPLLFYRRIADFSRTHLSPEGIVVTEINQWLSEQTRALFTEHGFTASIECDLFSAPRTIIARI